MSKLDELVKKLGELFELDKADLDFGIHRIIKKKHLQIKDYLENKLPNKVKKELEGIKISSNAAKIEELYNKLKEEHGKKAFDIENNLVDEEAIKTAEGQEYIRLIKSSGEISVDKIENDVFSHLLEFFSRYYEEGDFLSLRRSSTKAKYAVPYNGEEVVLHWANKDQYYIKSSEDFKDYVFTIDKDGKTQRVKFNVSKMDAVQNNNKAVRKFILDEEKQAEWSADGIVIHFHFKEFKNDSEGKKAQENLVSEILERLPNDWKATLSIEDTGYTGKGNRSILEKHVANFTKKNTCDYFIHKDLKGFLNQELDFYIKNEVMYLDDIDNRSVDYTNAEIRKIKVIRSVAKDLISFLAQLEDFQKKIWLKKKFVYDTQYCITIDKIIEYAPELLEEVAGSEKQYKEWVELFAINELEGAGSFPLPTDFLNKNQFLIVDTKHFDNDFKYRLLSRIDDIDNKLNGLLVHSENFQALNLLQERYKESVKCVYIDPPYNTGEDDFVYKDSYQHSSWASFIYDRTLLSKNLLNNHGFFWGHIDYNESWTFKKALDLVFGDNHFINEIIWKRRGGSSNPSNQLGVITDTIFLYKNTHEAMLNNIYTKESDEAKNYIEERFIEQDQDGRVYMKSPIVSPNYRENLCYNYKGYKHPPNGWSISEEVMKDWDKQGKLYFPEKGERIYRKIYLDEYQGQPVQNLWLDVHVINPMSLERVNFATQKPVALLKRIINFSCINSGFILDYFAGSGTTGHAVINLNREDRGNRKYILVEMGEYFHTVLLPRIKKVVYSEKWKDGKPVDRNGVSQFFKYFRLESYEDALNNLELLEKTPELHKLLNNAENHDRLQEQYLLNYMLDIETKGSLLSLDKFINPFEYTIKIYDRKTGEAVPTEIDLPETFNYLLGLEVQEIQKFDHILLIEGKNRAGETIKVLWRDLNNVNNEQLKEFLRRQNINPAETEFRAIYINGDTTLEDPHNKVRLIEETFHTLMFDVQEV